MEKIAQYLKKSENSFLIVKNMKGRTINEFTKEEMQEMIDQPKRYYEADNLPKWLNLHFITLGYKSNWKRKTYPKDKEFDQAYQKGLDLIKDILKKNKKDTIKIHDSDDWYEMSKRHKQQFR